MSYDVPRQRTWGWKVSSYIWTKSIAAGAGLVPALLRLAQRDPGGPAPARAMPLIALMFLALTAALLVADLKRPERFWTILLRPQWRSWLARGAVVITLYGALLAAWTVSSWRGDATWLDLLAWPVVATALVTAAYTAFLFAQCEGRDLWQSPLMAFHLVLHALIAGAAALLGVLPSAAPRLGVPTALALVLASALALLDAFGRHPTANAAAAAHALTRGPFAMLYWTSLLGGLLLPAALLLLGAGAPILVPAAAALALAGLWLQGHALVLAGQGPAIS